MVINYIAEMLLVIVGEEKRCNVFLLKNILKKAAIFILAIVQCAIFQLHTLFAKSRISLYKAFEGGDAVASLTENNAVEGNAGKQKRMVNW